MRKIKSCPSNLALLKNNKKNNLNYINDKKKLNIFPLINNNKINEINEINKFKKINLDNSKLFLNIGIDNFCDYISPFDELNKLIEYIIEFILTLIKNKHNNDIIINLIYNIIFRFCIYCCFHNINIILEHKIDILHKILEISN